MSVIIDIISYTAEQFAALNEQQLKEVREAQRKKDNLTLALGEKLQAQKDELVKKGIFNFGMQLILYPFFSQKRLDAGPQCHKRMESSSSSNAEKSISVVLSPLISWSATILIALIKSPSQAATILSSLSIPMVEQTEYL